MLGQCEQAAAPHQGFGPFAVDILDIRQPSHFLEVLLIVVDSGAQRRWHLEFAFPGTPAVQAASLDDTHSQHTGSLVPEQ